MADAGWYPDAADPHVTRYWDGSSWAAQRAWDGTAWVPTAVAAVAARVAPPVATVPEPAPTIAPTDARPVAQAALSQPASEPSSARPPANRRKLAVIGATLAAAVVLVVVGLSQFGGGGGGGSDLQAFCNDQRGREAAISQLETQTSLNRDRWTSSQKSAAKALGASLRAAASDAPAQVRGDSKLLAAVWTKVERGVHVTSQDRAGFKAAGQRVTDFNNGACAG